MGISSSIGSNTFDILLCLGLPWLIKSAFLPAEPGNHIVKINSKGLAYTAVSLLTTLLLLYGSFVANRFVLDRKIGFVCLIMYMIFLIFACMIELNVFFMVNLPPCGSWPFLFSVVEISIRSSSNGFYWILVVANYHVTLGNKKIIFFLSVQT